MIVPSAESVPDARNAKIRIGNLYAGNDFTGMITNFTEVRTVIIKESFVYWRSLPQVRMTFPI